jgi:hypothetical protein
LKSREETIETTIKKKKKRKAEQDKRWHIFIMEKKQNKTKIHEKEREELQEEKNINYDNVN